MPVFLVKGQLRQNYFLKKQAVMEKKKTVQRTYSKHLSLGSPKY